MCVSPVEVYDLHLVCASVYPCSGCFPHTRPPRVVTGSCSCGEGFEPSLLVEFWLTVVPLSGGYSLCLLQKKPSSSSSHVFSIGDLWSPLEKMRTIVTLGCPTYFQTSPSLQRHAPLSGIACGLPKCKALQSTGK